MNRREGKKVASQTGGTGALPCSGGLSQEVTLEGDSRKVRKGQGAQTVGESFFFFPHKCKGPGAKLAHPCTKQKNKDKEKE